MNGGEGVPGRVKFTACTYYGHVCNGDKL